jgi:hypothetical protein
MKLTLFMLVLVICINGNEDNMISYDDIYFDEEIIEISDADETQPLSDYIPTWNDCGNSVPFTTTSVSFNKKPAKNQSVTGTICGTVSSEQIMNHDTIQLLLNGKSLGSQTVGLGNADIPSGQNYCYSYTQSIPFIAPSGSYTLNSVLYNSPGSQIGCTQISFSL